MFTKINRTFQRRVYLFAASLTGLCLVLMLLTWLQGTRVRSATINTVKITQQGGQRLLLQLNQLPGTVNTNDISITPNTSFSSVAGGKTIALQFAQPLRNDTTYTLRIGTASGKNISYSFTTASASFFYVVNAANRSDIHQRWLGINRDTVVMSDETIDDYLVLGNTIIFKHRDRAGKDSLYLYNQVTRERRELALPEDGTIVKLQAAPDGKSFGFLFVASDYLSAKSNTIIMHRLDGTAPRQVMGFDNEPFKAMEWQFARNSKTIAALSSDSTLFLLNPGNPPVPFGQYDGIEGFSYDDSGMMVTDRILGKEILHLKSGQITAVSETDDGYPLAAAPFNTMPGSVLRIQSYGNQNGASTVKIVLNRGKTLEQAYSTSKYVVSGTLSPNDHYIAMELHDAGTGTDSIEIVDIWRDTKVERLNGSKARWTTVP